MNVKKIAFFFFCCSFVCNKDGCVFFFRAVTALTNCTYNMKTFIKSREKMLHPKWTRCCSLFLSWIYALVHTSLGCLVNKIPYVLFHNSQKSRHITSWTSYFLCFLLPSRCIFHTGFGAHLLWKCHWNGERANTLVFRLPFFCVCQYFVSTKKKSTTCKNAFVLISDDKLFYGGDWTF